MKTLGGIITAALALMLAAPAHADIDSDFVHTIRSHITEADRIGNDELLIKKGHGVCTLLGEGHPASSFTGMLATYSNIKQDDATFFVQSAEAAYCPQYLS